MHPLTNTHENGHGTLGHVYNVARRVSRTQWYTYPQRGNERERGHENPLKLKRINLIIGEQKNESKRFDYLRRVYFGRSRFLRDRGDMYGVGRKFRRRTGTRGEFICRVSLVVLIIGDTIMEKTDFCKRVDEILLTVGREMNGVKLESVSVWNGQKVPNVFAYAATCERGMEVNLEALKGCKRKSTFMSDLSIGEWCGGYSGVFDTLRRCMVEWRDDVEMMSEFVLCVNWKSWEHFARENHMWAKFYGLLYEGVRDLMYDYYEGDDEKTSYMWSFLD